MSSGVPDWTQIDWPAEFWEPEPQWHGPLTAEEQAEQDWYQQYEDAGPEDDDQAWREFEEAAYAEHIGAATRLMSCYLCYLEATGEADFDMPPSKGPLRGVVSESTVMQAFDPTAAYKLTCGHTII